jgi:Sigma-70 region 2
VLKKDRLPDFEQTVLPHVDAAYNLARWPVRSLADAEDVVQEACLRAMRFFEGSSNKASEEARPKGVLACVFGIETAAFYSGHSGQSPLVLNHIEPQYKDKVASVLRSRLLSSVDKVAGAMTTSGNTGSEIRKRLRPRRRIQSSRSCGRPEGSRRRGDKSSVCTSCSPRSSLLRVSCLVTGQNR